MTRTMDEEAETDHAKDARSKARYYIKEIAS
jgi:hypothetical protein